MRANLRPAFGVRTSNPSEILVADRLYDAGYHILKNGWPDFLAYNDDEIRFIEVKATCRARLSYRQRKMAEVLDRLGITVELVIARCVCGGCNVRQSEPVPLHDGSHRGCMVCEAMPAIPSSEKEGPR